MVSVLNTFELAMPVDLQVYSEKECLGSNSGERSTISIVASSYAMVYSLDCRRYDVLR
jgi:hypothetical protein